VAYGHQTFNILSFLGINTQCGFFTAVGKNLFICSWDLMTKAGKKI
jgi:hypothetical protein